jgi:hypothetical protein
MSLVWALIILEPELAQKHFEILKLDDNKKPLVIKPLDYGTRYLPLPGSIYNDTAEYNSSMPSVITPGYSGGSDDMEFLINNGWKTL